MTTLLADLELPVVEGLLSVPQLMESMPCTRPLLRDAAARFRRAHGMRPVSFSASRAMPEPANDSSYDVLITGLGQIMRESV